MKLITLKTRLSDLAPLEYVKIGLNTLKAYEWLSRLTYATKEDIYWLNLYTKSYSVKYNDDRERREVTIWRD